jgi:hypothetical protein
MLLWLEKYIGIKAATVRYKMYKIQTLIRAMVLLGCDSCTLTQTDEAKLSRLERKTLRKIYGPFCVNGVCRIKLNDEMFILYKQPSIVKMIKIARLKWLGHIAMMEERIVCLA